MRNALLVAAAALFAHTPALAQGAGQLVSADPVVDPPAGLQAWRIRYTSRDDRGTSRQLTGMVIAPRKAMPHKPRRVIAWTHGTWGIAENCAPSLSASFFALTPAIEAARQGYVVVAPDYPGLGSPGPHPFLVGTITARSVLDAVRAARQISGAAAGSQFAVWGESQGGHAALWTGQLARVEGAALQLVGVVAAAPPTDLAANFREASDPNARAFLTSLAASSWSRYYQFPLSLGRPRTAGLMNRLANNCVASGGSPKLGNLLGILAIRQDLRRTDLAALRPWSSYLAANSATPMQTVPVLIAQAQADPLVAPAVTRAFGRRLCANRVRVRWIDIPGKSHMTTAKDSAADSIRWINARFAGERAPDDCGRF